MCQTPATCLSWHPSTGLERCCLMPWLSAAPFEPSAGPRPPQGIPSMPYMLQLLNDRCNRAGVRSWSACRKMIAEPVIALEGSYTAPLLLAGSRFGNGCACGG